MQLHQIKVVKKNKSSKRVGRGPGSGHGKTSTRGHKGAGQRKGTAHYIGFQGGNVPYLRKIPKRGFTAKNPKIYQIVNLEKIINKLNGIGEIDPVQLKKVNLIRDENKSVKILGRISNKLDWKATFRADKFSRQAVKIIEDAGGKTECLKR
ncbi:MAG: 50S ribosomal protein L15 [Candidatus Omnitrophota bacterium]